MSCAPSVSFKAVGRLFAEKELLALKIQGKDGDLDDEDFEGNFNYHMSRTAFYRLASVHPISSLKELPQFTCLAKTRKN